MASTFGKIKWACPPCRERGFGQVMPHEQQGDFSDDDDVPVDPDSDDYQESNGSVDAPKHRKKTGSGHVKDKSSTKVKKATKEESDDDGSDGDDDEEEDDDEVDHSKEPKPTPTYKSAPKPPKCAVAGCKRPARQNNLYCSKDHAQQASNNASSVKGANSSRKSSSSRPKDFTTGTKSKKPSSSSTSKKHSPPATTSNAPTTADGKTKHSSETVTYRRKTRKLFGELVEAIFKEAKDGVFGDVKIAIDLQDHAGFAKTLETEIFNTCGTQGTKNKIEVGDKYKSKVRSLVFNFKDTTNTRLRKIIVTGEMDAPAIVHAAPEDLAKEDIVNMAETLQKQSMKNLLLTPSDLVPIMKKTHKGEIEIDYSQFTPTEGAPTMSATMDNDSVMMSASTISGSSSAALLGDGEVPEVSRSGGNSNSSTPTRRAPIRTFSTSNKRSAPESADVSPKRVKTSLTEEVGGARSATPSSVGDLDPMENEFYASALQEENNQRYSGRASLEKTPPLDGGQDQIPVELNRSYTPPGSPPPLPEKIWDGLISMQAVAKFSCNAKQVSGHTIAKSEWESILPETLVIEGRIATDRAEKYMFEQHQTPNKQVVVISFTYAATPDDEKNCQEFFDYFYTKARYAVVKDKTSSIKDMYICCLKEGDRLPKFVTHINGCQLPPGPAKQNLILGSLLLVGSGGDSTRRSSRRGGESGRSVTPMPAGDANMPMVTLPPLPINLIQPTYSSAAGGGPVNPLAMMFQHQQQASGTNNPPMQIPGVAPSNPILAILSGIQQRPMQQQGIQPMQQQQQMPTTNAGMNVGAASNMNQNMVQLLSNLMRSNNAQQQQQGGMPNMANVPMFNNTPPQPINPVFAMQQNQQQQQQIRPIYQQIQQRPTSNNRASQPPQQQMQQQQRPPQQPNPNLASVFAAVTNHGGKVDAGLMQLNNNGNGNSMNQYQQQGGTPPPGFTMQHPGIPGFGSNGNNMLTQSQPPSFTPPPEYNTSVSPNRRTSNNNSNNSAEAAAAAYAERQRALELQMQQRSMARHE
ncbi:hypothetical protein SmJEL517_g04328 [Synchytrium microbalum]|uniref:TFIIS central domain-containing protein n=1 Tax=Synchytrium microbalum TaxID=1806994 RepID=A0A507C4Z8_9FUNG|nr:uncharacterized protein SmJEL517_g04328 [Synchytrium microbalum]TPX32613.1 hypothetical protein SmJEL517_g04328 [Synchytrium microbalum]